MAWDIALADTGDWLFSGNRDILHVEGETLTHQRIITRLKIPRGTFIFDDDGDLGSRLGFALRYSSERAQREVPAMVEEALGPMTDEISINQISLSLSSNERQLVIDISYSMQPTDEESSETTQQFEELSLQVAI